MEIVAIIKLEKKIRIDMRRAFIQYMKWKLNFGENGQKKRLQRMKGLGEK